MFIICVAPVVYFLEKQGEPYIKKAYETCVDWVYPPIFEGPLTLDDTLSLMKNSSSELDIKNKILEAPLMYIDTELQIKTLLNNLQRTSIEMKVLLAYFLEVEVDVDENPLLNGTMALKMIEQENALVRLKL
jgi:hypothetical protein